MKLKCYHGSSVDKNVEPERKDEKKVKDDEYSLRSERMRGFSGERKISLTKNRREK